MLKRFAFLSIVSISLLLFSGLAWGSVQGTWGMSGKVTTTVKGKGIKTTVIKGTLDGDAWTFHSDFDFSSLNIGGTWSQTKTKFSVNLDDDDIVSFFEEMLSEYFETDITVTAITKKACTGTENTKKQTIKGNLKILMTATGYDEDCQCERTGKVTVSGNFAGTLLQAPAVNVSGYWNAYHTAQGAGEEGPDYFDLIQSGNVITGSFISGTGQNAGEVYGISGTVSGPNVLLFWYNNGNVSLNGSAGTDTMNGTYKDQSGRSGTWRAERTVPAIVTGADFSGNWKGSLIIEGEVRSSALTLDSNLIGSYVITGSNRVDTHSITGTVSNGVFLFSLPVSNLDAGSPDCANWNMQCNAALSENLLTLYLACSGTVCSASGGQPGAFVDILNKQ